MPVKVLMPALSPTMTEGNLVKWHKQEGDIVKSGMVLAEIETDKATMEVEAVDEGILGKILIPAGTENVKVNALIALILEEGEDASALDSVSLESPPLSAAASTPSNNSQDSAVSLSNATQASVAGERVFVTPLAKRIAQNNQIDLHNIQGSGPHGRIVKADVEASLNRKGSASSAMQSGTFGEASYKEVSLTNMRKVIARRLTESKQNVPHFYLTVECQLDALMDLRKKLNERPNASAKLTVNDFVIRASALALMEIPQANAIWSDTHIREFNQADVAVAVAVDNGLVTPVLRAANLKSITNLSTEMKSLAERARTGSLMPEEYQGGTLTISNLGMYGIKTFSAIINNPQAAILAVGAGEQRPVVRAGAITVATMMDCTLSADHRVVDGAVGAQFLAAFKRLLENPLELLV